MIFSPGLQPAFSRGRFVLKLVKMSGYWTLPGPYLEGFDPPAIIQRLFLISESSTPGLPCCSSFLSLPLSLSFLRRHPIFVFDRVFYGSCLLRLFSGFLYVSVFRRTDQTHRLIPKNCVQHLREPAKHWICDTGKVGK